MCPLPPKVSFLWCSGGACMVKCYAGSSIATGRASHARQVKGYDPDKNGYPGPPGWGLGMRLTPSPHKNIFFEKLLKLETDRNNKDGPAQIRIYKWERGMCCLCIEVVHCRN